MRVIEADKYRDFLNKYPLEKAQSNFMTFYRDALQHTFECEVEAIPIEYLKKLVGVYFDLGLDSIAKELKYIIWEWEKENERV